tara:strand:+ start:885 stop:1220 length:336 start_codon:yes stop_codon:yes gene_type:complete
VENTIQEDKLAPIVIDLTQKNNIDESWLSMFGEQIKAILKAMFGSAGIPVQVRGTKPDVASFVDSLRQEKKYIEAVNRYSLNSPRTYRSKAELDRATSQFERDTGIKWPFK